MAGDQKSLVCRRDFISDSSSDEELPVMDSLRDRLARKRQNIVASRLLHEDTLDRCLGQSSDVDVQGLTGTVTYFTFLSSGTCEPVQCSPFITLYLGSIGMDRVK